MIDAATFYEPSYTNVLAEMVDAAIQAEGPIKDDVLVRRIARTHGFQRAGHRIRERVLEVARRTARQTDERVGTFFWGGETPPEAWRWFRTPSSSTSRTVDEIPIEELNVLAEHLCARGYDGESAIREMAVQCGVKRVSSAIRGRLEQALPSPDVGP